VHDEFRSSATNAARVKQSEESEEMSSLRAVGVFTSDGDAERARLIAGDMISSVLFLHKESQAINKGNCGASTKVGVILLPQEAGDGGYIDGKT
jgi:hypothetical protein